MPLRVPDLMVRNIFEPLWDRYDRSVRLKELRALRSSQYLSSEEIVARQERKLRALLGHAIQTCPHYRQKYAEAGFGPADIRSLSDLRMAPLLTKDDVRTVGNELISGRYARSKLVAAKTGGSTGVALQVYCDVACQQLRNAAALRSDEWSGWRLGEPVGAVWGNPPVPSTFKSRVRRLLKDRVIFLDTMKLDDAAVDRFAADWADMRPGMLFGHAHSLFLLAEKALERNLQIRPRGIVATSMMLIDVERQIIERAFGVPVTNRYGCEEVSLIACECEQHRGLHLNSDHVVVEFLRPDGSPCAPGESGRIIVTELINYGMPMIRYEVGDWGVPTDRQCSCGRGLPLMESLTGRTADFLVAHDGSRVAGISLVERTLTNFAGIRQMQLVQDRRDALTVNLVADADYDTAAAEGLVAELRKSLGGEVAVAIVLVDRIPQETNGKYRFAICRVCQEQRQ